MNKKKKKSEGVGVEVFDSSKLHRAENARKVLKYLGTEGVDTGYLHNGDTPLHAYVRRQDKHKMECLMTFLIHAKYDVDMINSDGDSPLHLACKYADVLSAQALIVFDADINGFNGYNETPLDLAWRQCKPLTDLLMGIGGRESVEIMGELQVFGSQYNHMGGVRADGDVAWSVDGDAVDSAEGSLGAVGENGYGSGDEKVMQTPDCSVEMGITSFYVKSSVGRSPSDGVSETGILRDNPFFPKIDENSTTEYFPPSSIHQHGTKFRRSPQSRSPLTRSPQSSPSRSPPPRSPPSRSPPPSSPPSRSPPPPSKSPPPRSSRSRSPVSPRSQSPPVGSPRSHSVSRSRSPSPLAETRTAESGSSTPGGGREMVAGESEELEELKRNYAKFYPVQEESSEGKKGEREDERGEGESGDGEAVKEEGESQQEVVEAVEKGGAHGRDGVVKKEELIKRHGFVNYTEGEFFERLDQRTQEVLEKGLEDSLGDEGYAAWLQYREIQRFKRDRKAVTFEDSTEEVGGAKKGAQWVMVDREAPRHAPTRSILKDSMAPKRHPKQRKQVHLDIPSPHSRQHTDDLPPQKPPRLRRRQNPESSMMRSISTINPNMSVTLSVLGQSVVPLRRKMKKMGKRGHRILCLDGGGVKGLIQIEILRAIEELAGAPICDLFDWIVGTSTGGIVALGSVYGHLTLEDLRKIYFEMKESVFKSQSRMLTTACDTNALEEILKKSLGTENTMDEVKKPKVLVTAVKKETSDLPLVLFNNCFDDEYSTQKVWKVARYTSAAPVLFKECDNFIDGGVIANNPCNVALTHIKQHLRKLKEEQRKRGEKSLVSTDIACLCSVGCGIFPGEPIGNADIIDAIRITKVSKLPAKIRDTVNMLTTALTKSEDQSNMCRMFCEELEIPFHRLSPQVGEMIGTAETDDAKLCEAIICTKKMIYEEQDHLGELIKQLGRDPVPPRRITT